MVLVAYMLTTGTNTAFYGWQAPGEMAIFVSQWWFLFPNPVPEARHLFSREDTYRPAVRRIIGHDPPLAVWQCDGGLQLYAY